LIATFGQSVVAGCRADTLAQQSVASNHSSHLLFIFQIVVVLSQDTHDTDDELFKANKTTKRIDIQIV